MSEGGLLEKAAEQSPGQTVHLAEDYTPQTSNVGVGEALKTVALFGIIPVFIARILLVYLPGDELTIPVIGTSLVMAVVFLLSLVEFCGDWVYSPFPVLVLHCQGLAL